MLRTVHLHGRLGKRFGRTHRLDVGSPAEAISALMCQLPRFEHYIRHRQYAVTAGRSPKPRQNPALSEPALRMRLGHSTDIHIVPAPLMAGIETILIIGLTLVLVAVSVASIMMMPKAPKPGDREEASKATSFVFDGPENVIEQGHAVPLVYGEVRTGSVVVSSGLSTAEIGAIANISGGSTGWASGTPPAPGESGGSGLVGFTPGVDSTDEPVSSGGGRFSDRGDIRLFGGGKGGGGGAGAGDGMQEAPNSLRSSATARVLEVISEGEIIGLKEGMKSVYLDNTPIQNPDGTFNFQGVTVQQRVGLPDQDFVSGFPSAENSVAVDTEVSIAIGPVTRTIDDPDVTVARVTIRVPALYKQETDDGDINPTAVTLKISCQADGGGYADAYTMEINGKTNQPYDRSVDIHLPAGLERQVRVTRITADSDVGSLVNATRWSVLTEVIEAKLSYPDTALIGLTVDARQFGNNIPARSYLIRGLIIEVPTNYNPATRAYAGIWDGTFKRAWTNNPAWILRDLIVHRRYGLGARVPASALDKWALYSIAQYCDELIPNGFGGTAPRYTLNTVVANKMQAFELIASVASNFRGWVYWGSGSIVATMDRPEDPSVLITRSNVVDGLISYGRVTSHDRRRSVAVVYWNDPADSYRLVPEIVEGDNLVRRLGRREGQEVTAFGVTSRGHAHRLARFMLEDEAEGSNTVADYQVGDDHSFVAPGRIGMVADQMFTQNRRGGRVRDATAGSVQIDAAYEFVAGPVYTLRAMLPDGTVSVRPITNPPGATNLITLGGAAWAQPPNPGSVWTIETDVVANRQFRVRQIETDKPPYRVRAVLHDPTKYARVELDRDLETPNYIEVPAGPLGAPTQLGVFEYLAAEGTSSVPCALFSWTPAPDPRVLTFEAQAKGPTGDWFDLEKSLEPSRTVRPAAPGAWLFRVRGVDALGRTTAWQQGSADLDGQTDALPEVVDLEAVPGNALLAAMLTWERPATMRPVRYEVLHSPAGGFGTAVSLGTTDQLSFPITLEGDYWVRTKFLNIVSAAPPTVHVTATNFAAGALAAKINPTTGRIADPTIYNTQALLGPRSLTNLTPTYTVGGSNVTINLPAHDRKIAGPSGPITLHYGATSGVQPFSTYWIAYVDDPGLTGLASPSVSFTANPDNLLYPGRYQIASGTTPAAGGGGGTTGGGGGGSYADSCVAAEAWVAVLEPGERECAIIGDRRFIRARTVRAGDLLRVLDGPRSTSWQRCTANSITLSAAVRLTTRSGAAIDCSITTPITQPDMTTVRASRALESWIAAEDANGSAPRWERVVSVEPLGTIEVAHISADDGTYLAGNLAGRALFTHNLPEKP